MTATDDDTIAMPFLVKRLRNEAECWAVAANTYTGPRLASLLLEAADEIEALQRDIERAIANHAADLSGCSPDTASVPVVSKLPSSAAIERAVLDNYYIGPRSIINAVLALFPSG